MGYDIKLKDEADTLEIFLSDIKNDCEVTEAKALKAAGEKVKELVVANLDRHRRIITTRYKGRPAMADDVKVSIRTDKYGDKYAKVMGGKKTGTLWHLVNDGNLYSQPTHFMDEAMNKLDDNIDDIWEEAER